MPQFFPDGPAAVNLNNIRDQGGINLPPESPMTFETPGMQGSMQQLLSENLGKFVLADFLVGVSTIVRRVGILYSVGRSFVVLYLEPYHTFQVCDIFSLKFVSFFPPGSEPSLEDLMSGDFTSGILAPGSGGVLSPGGNPPFWEQPSSRSTTNMGSSNMNMGTGGNTASRNITPNGSRTLGQR